MEARSPSQPPPAIIAMGVSGSGKTVIGEALAERLGLRMLEGDTFHPAANVKKMSAGIPLTDADRWPWLDAIGAAIRDAPDGVIVACSALRRVYRERLAAAAVRPLLYLFLEASRETLAARLANRKGHFMPASLLDSQLATLEPPGPNEPVIRISVEPPIDAVVEAVLAALARHGILPPANRTQAPA
jgi:gluconokinase